MNNCAAVNCYGLTPRDCMLSVLPLACVSDPCIWPRNGPPLSSVISPKLKPSSFLLLDILLVTAPLTQSRNSCFYSWFSAFFLPVSKWPLNLGDFTSLTLSTYSSLKLYYPGSGSFIICPWSFCLSHFIYCHITARVIILILRLCSALTQNLIISNCLDRLAICYPGDFWELKEMLLILMPEWQVKDRFRYTEMYG